MGAPCLQARHTAQPSGPQDCPSRIAAGSQVVGGKWHTEGWTGAVLTATAWLEGDTKPQAQPLSAFLGSAVPACRALVEVMPHAALL